jgi:hypothetical protein
MYVDQHESTSRDRVSFAAQLSIEQLGKQIAARVEAGEKAAAQAKDRFLSAGLMLVEAKSRVPDFSAFLRDHCNGLSRSRAYELIKIAGGDVDEVRANTNERKRRYRARRAASAATTTVRSGTDAKSASAVTHNISAAAALAEFKFAANVWFPKMTDADLDAALAYATRLHSILKHDRTTPRIGHCVQRVVARWCRQT